MVLSHEDERTHPYWYARVVQIFHVNVEHRGHGTLPCTPPTRIDCLFVRWFRRDVSPAGWAAKRLQRLEFFDEDSLPDAFGFLDPNSVVRGVHLIPAFNFETTNTLLGPTFARKKSDSCEEHSDWRFYYVNIFVDRDMFMRFRGGGVGHKATRDWDEFLQREGHDEAGSNSSDSEEGVEGEGSESEDDDGGLEVDEEQDGQGDEDVEDRVIADDGEELDDDVLAQEGYGAL
ncbi:hypothetical protein DEU56DRAFT_825868 [Suillus clintonianus]|uniref:uncharacterized protein n=1 Tax=Suillus clintonianus TaxID=1904413 RepID=UPI001B8627C2|nr:uncharacterized protein DEU56DRAFT_825868 [Suillus clintonianus]KAG2125107.1 hypothetical protein DEU56DRAFT_825868 [Suillus clintonianus]